MSHRTLMALSLALLCCLQSATAQRANSYEQLIDSIRTAFSVDKRTTVFSFTVTEKRFHVLVEGETSREEIKNALLGALGKRTSKRLVDDVVLLPLEPLRETKGIVRVSVANVRSRTSESSELVTQILMGSQVQVLRMEGGWAYVQLPDSYLGWIDTGQLSIAGGDTLKQWEKAKKGVVTVLFDMVREKASVDSDPVSDVVGGNVVEILRPGKWTQIALPDGRKGFIYGESVRPLDEWRSSLSFREENIVRTARQFTGIPYLWGGTSFKGVDCSGFTKTVYRMNGFELQRDADMQAKQGIAVPIDDSYSKLRKGDLVCFTPTPTTDENTRITHIGIYLGDRLYIHSSSLVKINSFDPAHPLYSQNLKERLLKVRRVLGANDIDAMRIK